MNSEARILIEEELSSLRLLSYTELRSWMPNPAKRTSLLGGRVVFERHTNRPANVRRTNVVGPSGLEYEMLVEIDWDNREQDTLRGSV